MKYKGIYTDSLADVLIEIDNDFKNLRTEINGVQFKGTEFSDFEPVGNINYEKAQIARFSFLSLPVLGSDIQKKTLCNCTFNIEIPQSILNTENNTIIPVFFNLKYSLGSQNPVNHGLDFEEMKISFTMNGQTFSAKSGFIEDVFDEIGKQMGRKFRFKNCYGCMYGDYSVYGQSGFASMQCFVAAKLEYLNVKTKIDFMTLTGSHERVQEIFCCEHYEIRQIGVGYRG